MARRVAGIDVGGTFTDLLLLEEDEAGSMPRVLLAKTPTTPDNQAAGVLAAIHETGVGPETLDLVVHGTTTTTNAVLERKIAACGLITTRGFRDVLELGRRTRPQAYGMVGQFEPLIPRQRRLEVTERMLADGSVLTALDEDELRAALRRLLELGTESLVIHFLHAYANPAHERRAGEIAAELWPNDYITLGHELSSEFREYERGTTASINAAVRPLLERYLKRLEADLGREGYARDILVMTGNGGTVSSALVQAQAAKTVMSGPASGVKAAAYTGRLAGLDDLISYDMGGTSTDVALIRGGVPEVSSELEIAYGLPIHVPMVDVRSIGAGGGSIGRIDAGGILKVGPESAGARPGPICYGLGGRQPTVTDANLLLGRLGAKRLLAVERPAPRAEIEAVFERRIAAPLGLEVAEAAAAMIRIANIGMAGAVRMVSLGRGLDPRDFALFAFGGAGPMHAVALAAELSIPKVLVPARPGMTNALGCLVADLRQDFVNTVNLPLDQVEMGTVHALMAEQCRRGLAINAAEKDEIVATTVLHSMDMQFQGQTHLLTLGIEDSEISREALGKRFAEAYYARFAVRLPELRPVLVNVNTSVIGRRREVALDGLLDPSRRAAEPEAARTEIRPVYFDGAWLATPVYDREALPSEAEIAGPAIVEQMDATVVVEPGTTMRTDAVGNILVEVPLKHRAPAPAPTLEAIA
jgi:N-methylhydantoinase A